MYRKRTNEAIAESGPTSKTDIIAARIKENKIALGVWMGRHWILSSVIILALSPIWISIITIILFSLSFVSITEKLSMVLQEKEGLHKDETY